MSAIAITTPATKALFQRTLHVGDIPIVGTYTFASACHIEASFNGGAYVRIATLSSGTGQPYSGTLSAQAQGQGTLTVRFEEDQATSASVTLIGIGELLVAAGQSNMSGRYTNPQSVSSTDGFTAVEYNDAGVWATLADPYTADTSSGSFLPRLATLLMNTYHVPVGVVPAPPIGGTGWTSWIPGGSGHTDITTLYGAMNVRMAALGSIPRAVMMWDGETDALVPRSQAAVQADMNTFVDAVYADRGAKTMICKLQICTGITDSDTAKVRAAAAAVWVGNAHALTGPDFSDMMSDDAYHFITDPHCQTVAQRWADALLPLLTSPSASISASPSPSVSSSPSASLSPSSSTSPSISLSPSPSASISPSPSPGSSLSVSPSVSPSISASPSRSQSPSASESASISPSASASRSPSPSPGLPRASPDTGVIC